MNNTPKVKVATDKCNNCGMCVDSCLFDAIEIQNANAVVVTAKCTFCMVCIPSCPQSAIFVDIGI